MAKIKVTDLSNDFSLNPLTGDLSVKKDTEVIKQSLRNLLLMNKFDKPFDPLLDSGLRSLLFENFPDPIRKIIIKEKVEYIINRYEPRVQVKEVEIQTLQDDNLFTIQITYNIVGQESITEQSLRINLERNR